MLTGVVVEFEDGQKIETDENGVGVIVPKKPGMMKVGLAGGVATAIRVMSEKESQATPRTVPRVAASGGLLRVALPGGFDGIAENTKVSLGGQPCAVVAESPHEAIIQVPPGAVPGSRDLRIEDGEHEITGSVAVCSIGISADRLQLKRGESTQGRVRVEGISPNSVGCTVRVQNLSPTTVRIQPGKDAYSYDAASRLVQKVDAGVATPDMRQAVGMKTASPSSNAFVVTLTDVMVANGAVEIPFAINSLQTGSFSVVATITDPADSQKKTCTCGCKGTPRPLCAHTCGGDPCTG